MKLYKELTNHISFHHYHYHHCTPSSNYLTTIHEIYMCGVVEYKNLFAHYILFMDKYGSGTLELVDISL